MNKIIDYNNLSLYKFNNNLEVEIPINYISFYKVKDKMVLFPHTLHLQINQSVARKYK